MNIAWVLAIIFIESGGNACIEHRNPKIHGASGMSKVALIEIGYTPADVQCNLSKAKKAAWKYQLKYKHLTKLDPYKMAQLHAIGPGNFVKGNWNIEYKNRFFKRYKGKK